MNVIGKLRAHRLRPLIHNQKQFYDRDWSPAEIRAWQLDQFNEQWQIIQQNVPYFARLARERSLPERFDSWMQFREELPVVNRDTVQEHGDALANTTSSPDFRRVTGGSTGEPVQIPAWSSEQKYEQRDYWYARDWYGITPADRLFLLWGHSHIFREGIQGRWDELKRGIKDWLLGYHRFSAYDLSESALREAADELLSVRPEYVIGYSEALDRLARMNKDRADKLRQLDLKAIIATAESFPRNDSADIIEDVFEVPVVMEYGTAETGPIAHQRPDGSFQIFWRHYKVEGRQSESLENTYEIFITTLYPRCFPLVRYRVGDLIYKDPNRKSFNQKVSSIVGRSNDYIETQGGRRIHSIVFKHALEDLEEVKSYQVVSEHGEIEVRCIFSSKVNKIDKIKKKIKNRINNLKKGLGGILVTKKSELEKTKAGKVKKVIQK